MLADQVKAGTCRRSTSACRSSPWWYDIRRGDGPGQPGGQLNMLVASARDSATDDGLQLHPPDRL